MNEKQENKREKERMLNITDEQIKNGKAELMKIVAGMNGAEKLADLLDKGKKKGSLSSSEMMDVLESMELESEQMDKIYDVLENLGIDTAGEDFTPEIDDENLPTIQEIEDRFGEVGKLPYLREAMGLTVENIVAGAKKALALK